MTDRAKKTGTLTMRLTQQSRDALEAVATLEDRSVSEIAERAIRSYLQDYKPEIGPALAAVIAALNGNSRPQILDVRPVPLDTHNQFAVKWGPN